MNGNITESVITQNCAWEQLSACSTSHFVLDTLIIGSICILGIFGNILSIFVLSKDRSNGVMTFLLQTLTAVDTVALIVVFVVLSVFVGGFSSPAYVHILGQASPYLKKYAEPVAYMAQTCTIWMTVVLAVNRYLAVCYPFKVRELCTMFKARIEVAVVILGSLCFNIPRFFQVEIVNMTINCTGYSVDIAYPKETAIGESTIFGKIYTNALYFLFIVIVPTVLLLVLNTRLIKELGTAKQFRRHSSTNSYTEKREREDNINLIMILIIVVLLLCHTPDRIRDIVATIYRSMGKYEELTCGWPLYYVTEICNLLVALQSSGNFIIYYLCRRQFRCILRKLVCGRFHRRFSSKKLPLLQNTQDKTKSLLHINDIKRDKLYTSRQNSSSSSSYLMSVGLVV